jgi:hypothetical protein
LGYSADDLKKHMEKQFISDMSWKNHGELWHIDHNVPLSAFKHDTPIRVVNSLINLKPMFINDTEIEGTIYEGNKNKFTKLPEIIDPYFLSYLK